MVTRERKNEISRKSYHKRKEKLREIRENNSEYYAQQQRDQYWKKKNGNGLSWNMAFIKYIIELLKDDKKIR